MYIGVTGFTSRFQVHSALLHVPRDDGRLLMVGVLATRKTIQGLTGGNSLRNPKREDIAGIFVPDWRALNLVHYCTRDQNELAAQLWAALEWGGPNCDGLQLNIVWPDTHVLRELKRSSPDTTIVLQINRRAMEWCDNNPERVAERVCREYARLVDYVLVDASGGRGVLLMPEDASAYLVALDRARERLRERFELVVAGGLSADNLEQLLTPVRMHVPRFGIDTESAVRTDDLLDDRKVAAYLETAYRFLK